LLKKNTLLLIFSVIFLLTLISPNNVKACYQTSDAIEGYVYWCEDWEPKPGVTVTAYRITNPDAPIMEGTDVTDENGHFRIENLYAKGEWYKIEVSTDCGITLEMEVQVFCGKTTYVTFHYCCDAEPRTIGYWKNHPEEWPVDSLEIGGITYTQEELLNIMWHARAKDATSMLASQLIAAKLNVLSGVYSASISDTIDEADDFLIEHPLGSNPRGKDRSYALEIKDLLDCFNNGS